jgi:hypothetical protein
VITLPTSEPFLPGYVQVWQRLPYDSIMFKLMEEIAGLGKEQEEGESHEEI